MKRIWLALALAACSNELERPRPPDLSDLEARYALVTGTLDPRTARLLVDASAEKLGFAENPWAMLDLILGIFDDVQGLDQTGENEQGVTRQALTAADLDYSAGAWGVYFRRCPGWVGDGPGERGNLRMTVLFTDEGLEPVLWGAMYECHIEAGKLSLNGELAIKLEGLTPTLTEGITGYLIRFSGDYEADGERQRVAFDARYLPGDALVTVVELETGERFLVGVGFDGSVRVVDTRGDWRCTEDTCRGPDAEEFMF